MGATLLARDRKEKSIAGSEYIHRDSALDMHTTVCIYTYMCGRVRAVYYGNFRPQNLCVIYDD